MKRLLQRMALYAFHIFVARPLLLWVAGVRYRRKHLAPEGPCLVVSNHNSHLDAGVLMTMFPLRRLADVHPVAAADYFGSTWFMRTIALLLMNGIPFERRPVRGEDPLTPIAERLKMGETLIFFPEGSRGEAGVVAKFRPGVGRLVRSVPGLLVVPVFLSGPERIWPRGEVVPVPLSVDVNIGRPRVYSAELSPKEIADQVREAVLALAPPPPPVPGPLPGPPVRIAVCSIDRDFRDRAFRRITETLGPLGRTLGVGKQVFESDAQGVREATGPIAAGFGRVLPGLLAGVFGIKRRMGGDRFARLVERAQVNEALEHDRETRFVVVAGSAMVDLMALSIADSYQAVFGERGMNRLIQYLAGEKRIPVSDWWKFTRKAPEVWMINVLELARPPVPDVLLVLKRPVGGVMRRLRSRGATLGPYDNEPFLERLQASYREAAEMLRSRRKIHVLELDTSDDDVDVVARRVEETCRELSEEPRSVAPGP